jgi:hypothetical protein
MVPPSRTREGSDQAHTDEHNFGWANGCLVIEKRALHPRADEFNLLPRQQSAWLIPAADAGLTYDAGRFSYPK